MTTPANLGRGAGVGDTGEQATLFPAPEFSPTLPDPSSRRAAILAALRRGERLNHADAIQRGWGWRLAADIFALKDGHGWKVESVLIHRDRGNAIAEYWLPVDATHLVREG